MITVTVTTQICFSNEDEVQKFIEKDAKRLLYFDKEILESKEKRRPVVYVTDRPEIGAVAVSTVSYSSVKP